ncbi:hypothetical protein MPDQ_005069 [Monascus purpureus]|uniref:Guanine nucleotide-exchange factor SEC12 n=1 Tax=Monascus purpureus TaxID=5098 RepID=A0A507QZF1_MONPU|nr:hypothetical protein MPDQ_005069 [Monascus purpureus]
MAPSVASAGLTLSCPLFAADFDPQNSSCLLVLLDTSKRSEISAVTDIELSRDEDSVTSLAAALPGDNSIVALAGINSSSAEQQRGNNQHFRSFQVDYPSSKPTATDAEAEAEAVEVERELIPGKISALSHRSLFRARNEDVYQRILRMSPWKGPDSPRVGAIASGLAQSGEIVFFNAMSKPTESDVIGRINLGADSEAEDVDIIDVDNGKFRVAYTNGVEVCTCEIFSETRSDVAPEVASVYSIPQPDKRKSRPKFRALRFISATALVLLQNAPDRSGCQLFLLQISELNRKSATVIRCRKLHRTMKIGLGLDVCNLGGNQSKEQQSIVAVSGSDNSIGIFSLEYSPKEGYGQFQPYTVLKDVHPFSMTKISFSTFVPPTYPISAQVPPQYVKLASVSMGNTVVVHTFPLGPYPPVNRTPRYVLAMPVRSDFWMTVYSVFVTILFIIAGLVIAQGIAEYRGIQRPYILTTDWVPSPIREIVAPRLSLPGYDGVARTGSTRVESIPSAAIHTIQFPKQKQLSLSSLLDIAQSRKAAGTADFPSDSKDKDTARSSVVVRYNGADIEVSLRPISSPSSGLEHLRRWNQLSKEEHSLWKQRLLDAGYWAAEEGETILQGVLFGELNGFIENSVRESLQ